MKFFKWIIYIFAVVGFVLVAGYFAVKFGWTNTSGIIDTQRQSFLENATATPEWANGAEWQTFESAVLKDKTDIDKAAALSEVPPRLIVANLLVEQLRLFYTDRELFEQVFAPLKILGDQSQFSWGVMGVKQDTAIEIENNLKATSSPFYLGASYAHLLDFTATDTDSERFSRLTDDTSRFYSYLYSGIFLQEIITQWKNAGYDISNRPDILSTIFNIGFAHSIPNGNPQVGGSEIDIGGQTYSFGGLAGEFYNSNLLVSDFPPNTDPPQTKPFTILVVPGHDTNTGGAQFRDIYERDIVVDIAEKIADELNQKSGYKVIVARNTQVWNPILQNYFDENKQSIIDWKDALQAKDKTLMATGQEKVVPDMASHSEVNSTSSLELYGTNKWTNENDVDMVIHLHFNNTERTDMNEPGSLHGFTMFIPDSQRENSTTSRAIAKDIYAELKKDFSPEIVNNDPDGLIEDQSLIALGASNTLTKPAMLIEYGYVYDQDLWTLSDREKTLSAMATETVAGIIDYVNNKK